MRKPFKKNLNSILVEEAHAGSGRRQVILSRNDAVSEQLQAMTKGFLSSGSIFDWHVHENIDELFLVIKGNGIIEFKSGEQFEYSPDDLIYIPDGIEHKIEATGKDDSEFFFIRLNT
ncbi:MAG: cupin domain-containing protein [Candidatus Moranbacteria bacterium]|jgi:mannose-6-phosphate isomerase-like protein (cupin superfamily)|nr:cupin domain-containing protein [Candidatus Moranbacteria bacterium]